MTKINRRSFLKLAAAAAPAILWPQLASRLGSGMQAADSSIPNVIILLFDAMTARNLSVYGYPRPTTPNFERFAERATVYHSHNAPGNYTITGTASLLTGTYPWKHRAINYRSAVRRDMARENIFNAFGHEFNRLAFPQNPWANFFISQFQADIEKTISPGSFSEYNFFPSEYFPGDKMMAVRALDDFMFRLEEPPASLTLTSLQRTIYFRKQALTDSEGYPRGLPYNIYYPFFFRLEKVFDGLASLLSGLQPPFFTYLHLFPPHLPYRPMGKFNRMFVNDGFTPIVKPDHRLSDHNPVAKLTVARQSYDQYVASLDSEFGRLLDVLETEGLLDNSYFIITADHGEMFERGEKAHTTPLLYDPVVHIPLLISAPGQSVRRDIYAPTNAVDVLPTLMHLTGRPIPAWSEGKLLPGLGGEEDFDRSTFTIEAKLNPASAPLTKATIALRKGNHKLIYYTGYESEDAFELYDLGEDLEEMKDLFPAAPAVAKKMKDELLETLLEKNKPYMK